MMELVNNICGTIAVICGTICVIVYVLTGSKAVKDEGGWSAIAGFSIVVGFFDFVTWLILYIWS